MPLITIAEFEKQGSFDYVIAGGGTSGLTLAGRLAEDKNITVLVLEAGLSHEKDGAISIPAQFGSHLAQPKYCWMHKTVPQPNAGGRSFDWQRGRGLGGTAAINFSIWTLPQKQDIDDWEKMGNVGWNAENFFKFANRAITFTPRDSPTPNDAHPGAGEASGGLNVTFPKTFLNIDREWQRGLFNQGVQPAKAPLAGDPNGAFFCPNTLDPNNHSRSYSASVYFEKYQGLPNLFVLGEALVAKVVLQEDQGSQKATGVEFQFADEKETRVARVNKEVILSAGALKSAHLLELSGIGNKEILEKVGIPTLVDLPGVGENVQEHLFSSMTVQFGEKFEESTLDDLMVEGGIDKNLKLFGEGKGLFTLGITATAFVPLSTVSSRAKEILESGVSAAKAKISSGEYSLAAAASLETHIDRLAPESLSPPLELEIVTMPGFLSGPNPPNPGKRNYTIGMFHNKSLSRGTIHIKSKDPKVDPEFDPHYFENPADLQAMVENVKFVRKVTQSSPFKEYLDTAAPEVNPGVNVQTDEEIASWLLQTFGTTWHTNGTCSLLPRSKGGVVDNKLQVYGTKNLRVVDVSIVPLQTSCHTQSLAYGIAEQAAAIIQGKLVL
ncbi:hypothetical protein C8J56DRAFT_960284 [Mycena floridula]|nr:hypothetical protein C8J56DRAFT_960284 [Mycena floridula]